MMEFTHDNEGIHIKYKNKYLILNGAAVTKELLSDDELLSFSKEFLKFNQAIGRISNKEVQPEELKITLMSILYDQDQREKKWRKFKEHQRQSDSEDQAHGSQ